MSNFASSLPHGQAAYLIKSQGTELQMPAMGYGTWRLEPDLAYESLVTAIKTGYRHIDCAEVYGNQEAVGLALRKIMSEGLVKREDLWITSKLFNSDHARESVLPALKKTMSALQVDYLDLYLMHWPVTGTPGPTINPSLEETWLEMETLVKSGLVRAIGVSNFSNKKIKGLQEHATIVPAVNQVEIHPYFRNDSVIQFCKENGIHVTAYCPLGGAPENEGIVRKSLPKLLQDAKVVDIAKRLNKSPAQVLIRWALQHGTSVIPKSSKPVRIKENFDVFSWAIPDADFLLLSSLSPQTRMLDGSFFTDPRGPFVTIEDLWDEA